MPLSDFDAASFWPAIKQFVIDAGIEPISLGEGEAEVQSKILAAMAAKGTPLSLGMDAGQIRRALAAGIRGGSPVITLSTLSMSPTSFAQGAAAGTVIGTVSGLVDGSSWAVFPNDGRVAKSGNNLVVGLTQATGDFSITLRHTHPDAVNSPLDTVVQLTVTVPADTTAPTITSSAAHSVAENSAYSATATANEAVTWAKGGADAALVTLNTGTGAWSVAAQDFETKPSLAFNLTATDAAGNASTQSVTLTITDVNEVEAPPAPEIIFLPTIAGKSPNVVISTSRLVADYSGPALRAQRASDDVEQDIAFSGQYMDKAAADAFRGASGLGVKKWYDQSGLGWHVEQLTKVNQPILRADSIWGSAPTVTFDSDANSTPKSSKRISNTVGPSFVGNSVTIFAVFAPNHSLNLHGIFAAPPASNAIILKTDKNSPGIQGIMGPAFTSQASMVPLTKPNVVCLRGGATSAERAVRINGIARAIPATPPTTVVQGFALGAAAAVGVLGDARMEAFAYVVYPVALTDAECVAVENALTSIFPVSTAGTAKVIFDGDSRTEGAGFAANPWTKRLTKSSAFESVVPLNMAVSGQKLSDMATAAAARITAQYDATKAKNIVVMGGPGINDIGAGVLATAVQDSFVAYANNIHASQVLIAATIPPASGTTGTQRTELDAYNTWLRANYLTYAEYLVDLAADSRLVNYSSTYNVDFAHMNDAGQAVWFELFAPVISAALAA